MARISFFNPIKSSNKNCKIVLKPSSDENDCGSMFEQLPLCIGARVICRRNIDFDGTIVNGTEATVKDIIWDNDNDIVLPMSNRCVFPNLDIAITAKLPKYIELELNNGSIYKMSPEEVSFKDKNGIWMTRKQLPLTLGYAITVHRSQCMTYDKLVVDLTGLNWKPGMFYTILSRTRKLTDIIILAYDRKSFKRYIDWCLPQLSTTDAISSKTSNNTNITTFDCGDIKRLKSEKPYITTNIFEKKPEDVIVCEDQMEHFCGRHVLRALSQNRQIFSDKYLIETGDYDIQILIAALLNVFDIDLIKIDKLEKNNCPIRNLILSHTQNIQAFLIQQNYHYYCLRQFRLTKDYFFKIDSKQPTYHQPIHQHNILKFIGMLLQYKSHVYVTIQHIEDDVNHGLSTENIAAKLWALPDAPADLEILTVSPANEQITLDELLLDSTEHT
ncbi:unnamed protein product [Rotaria magnacalcarata]|uniref:ubiquitinyl hydrolase 1 n=1 Tax=Rotaria magnacalcarata TaxID=392030 RepID=A0A816MLA4_9BILA|nr:unnamed protein product [Rotaria magnacalcarata]